jgi:hypothetical protein
MKDYRKLNAEKERVIVFPFASYISSKREEENFCSKSMPKGLFKTAREEP